MRTNPDLVYDVEEVLTLRQLIDRSAERYAKRTAFHVRCGSSVEEVSYADFYADVQALAACLTAQGLAGRKIALIGKNSYAWAMSYFAVTAGCGVIVPFDKEYRAAELCGLARDADIAAVIYANDQADKLEALPTSVLRLPMSSFPDYIAEGMRLREAGDRSWENYRVDPFAPGVLIYTSGTTGVAKGVMLSQYNICSDLIHVMRIICVYPDDRALSILPMHHTYECLAGFLSFIWAGASIAFNESMRSLQADFARYQPTVLVVVPLLLERLRDKILRQYSAKKGGMTLLSMQRSLARGHRGAAKRLFAPIHQLFGGRLRALLCGAAALDPEVFRDYEAFGFSVYCGYGLTETAPVLMVHSDQYRSPDNVGRPLPGVEAKLLDVNDEGVGELVVRGSNIMLGYYNDPAATAAVIRDGWFYTGDLARRDPATGAYSIVGRCKTMIVTKNGKKIFPEEIEYYLAQSPYVADCMAYGDESGDDVRIVAAVYPDEEAVTSALSARGLTPENEEYASARRALVGEAVKAANRALPAFKHVHRFVLRETPFIKTTTQKIKRNAPENRLEGVDKA